MKNNGSIRLRKDEYGCLVEALRRHSRFFTNPSGGPAITSHWTGLGSATTYKQAVEAGYMTLATASNPGHDTWWRLTEKGAKVICFWLGAGYDYKKVEFDTLPPATIPEMIL